MCNQSACYINKYLCFNTLYSTLYYNVHSCKCLLNFYKYKLVWVILVQMLRTIIVVH